MKIYYISIDSLGVVKSCNEVDGEDIMYLLTGTEGETIEKICENVIKINGNFGHNYYLISTRKDIIGAIQMAIEINEKHGE